MKGIRPKTKRLDFSGAGFTICAEASIGFLPDALARVTRLIAVLVAPGAIVASWIFTRAILSLQLILDDE